MKPRRKSTEYWKNVFKKWANERNLQPNLEDYQSDILDETLSQFYAELRKENCDDYEPDCLKLKWCRHQWRDISNQKPIQIPSSKIESFLTPEQSWMGRLGISRSKAKESNQTDPQVWQKKRKKSSGRTASLEKALHELYLTPCGGCSHCTSA